ncbi:MAG: system potassium uptake protein [Alphaproteobacteria bacterium]|jgi:KUP system potassium uptake protein|nr:system potassium uptake protein [Alphaproteobacteria bacterium]
MSRTEAARGHGVASKVSGAAWRRRQAWLTLGALGVVYGDIGTSPLYAVRQSVLATGGGTATHDAVLGAISLILWSLIIIVTIKYIVFILRADNKGEGGVIALASLAHRCPGLSRRMKTTIGAAGVLGLALFFGDGMLTPAISVLSAVEGIKLEEPELAPLVLPLTLIILLGLFLIQNRGTGRLGRLFGPIVLLWFLALAALGVRSIAITPSILLAVNPWEGIGLFVVEPWVAFVALGSVVLTVTGVETLYADMGHFGRTAIRLGWLAVAFPALILNYLGQGALLLRDPAALENPFYGLAPEGFHYPLVALATVATIIASQAVISGVFSITRQSVQLGQLPRMEIRHTSATDYGQIYVPRANTLMLIGVIAIVLIYKNSDALAAAYGMAVTGMMSITTFLGLIVVIRQWHWKPVWIAIAFTTFILTDLTFLGAVSLKLFEGAWLPLAIAAAVFVMMETWRGGKRVLLEKAYGSGISTDIFLERADKTPIRIAGTAIFTTPRLDEVPGSLLHNLKHNKVLHERVIFLRVDVQDVPFVPPEKRLTVNKLGKGFYTVEMHFGFFQTPDVPAGLEGTRAHGLALDLDATTFFIRRETLIPARVSALAKWQTRLFIKLYASALEAAQFYRLPPGRVVELGSQTEI